jgi:hypothetical protein
VVKADGVSQSRLAASKRLQAALVGSERAFNDWLYLLANLRNAVLVSRLLS